MGQQCIYGLGKGGKGSKENRGLCGASLFPSHDGRRRGWLFRTFQHCHCQENGASGGCGYFLPHSGNPDSRTDAQTVRHAWMTE